MMDFDTLPVTNIDMKAAADGCKYVAALVQAISSGERRRFIWATGIDSHARLLDELRKSLPGDEYEVIPDGGGFVKYKERRNFWYIYGTSTDFGPDLYLRSTLEAIKDQYPDSLVGAMSP